MEIQNTQPLGTPPDNNLVWAILCTVLCCLPFGIVSIIKATKVNEFWAQGDTIGAQRSADEAKKWAIWGAVIGPVLILIFYAFMFIIGMGGFFLDSGGY
jgi:uncharacterized membrane protein